MCKSHFTFKRFLLLLGQVLFINWALLAVNLFVFGQRGFVITLKQVFPVSSNLNWFITAYLAVYMLGPFIQKATKYFRGNSQAYNVFISVLFVLFGLIGFVTPTTSYYSGIAFGIYIVFIGDYIEFNKERIVNFPIKTIGSACFIILMGIRYALDNLSRLIPVVSDYVGHFENNSSPLITIVAICVLLSFSKLQGRSKVINLLASSTLTVYFIHDNDAFKEHVWFDILKLQNHVEHMYIYMVLCIVLIFLGCFFLDQIRKRTVEKVWIKVISPPCSKLDKAFEKILMAIRVI